MTTTDIRTTTPATPASTLPNSQFHKIRARVAITLKYL